MAYDAAPSSVSHLGMRTGYRSSACTTANTIIAASTPYATVTERSVCSSGR
jgi:hypothetical protein